MKESISRRDFLKGFDKAGAGIGALAIVASLASCGTSTDPITDPQYKGDLFPGQTDTYVVGNETLRYKEGHFQSITLGGVTKNAWPTGGGGIAPIQRSWMGI
jgi:hypothetical protein